MILIVALGLWMAKPGNSESGVSGAVVAAGGNGVQEIVLGMKNYNYYPNSITVESGQPIKISADDSVSGCFRDLVVRGTDVRKYLRTPQDSVEFTIDTPGTYTFACSMGMGSGKLVVE